MAVGHVHATTKSYRLLSVGVSPEMLARLNAIAAHNCCSVGAVVRMLVGEALEARNERHV